MAYKVKIVSVVEVLCIASRSRGMIGVLARYFYWLRGVATEAAPHSGQTMAGNPSGSTGGKASTTISSTQSVWLQERQRYLYQLLGTGLKARNSSMMGSVIVRLLKEFMK